MDLHLALITRENWEQALTLQVSEAQRHFTPAVAVSLAKISIKPDGDHVTYVPFGIFVDGALVGFIMHAYEKGTRNMYWINGFLIDEKYQGQGYGKAALGEMVRLITQQFGECEEIRLTVHKNNVPARNLYLGFGFHPTGDFFGNDEEILAFSVK